MEPNTLRLLIVSDDPLARAGLAALLNNQPELAVVGQLAASNNALAADAAVYQPDLVLFDLGWDPASALDQSAALSDIDYPTLLLLPDETLVADAWATGAHGLLLRETPPLALFAALQAVAQGLLTIDPALANQLIAKNPGDIGGALIEPLTPRELEVLHHLAEGLPNKTIAQRLDISEHTVKFHVTAIMGKLGAQSRTEAAVRATQMGLLLL